MVQTTTDDTSARPAPVGGGAEARPSPLDWTLEVGRVSWETLAWLVVMPLALVPRLVWLNGWPLSQSEASIASTIWALLLRGQVTSPPSVEAGPVVTLLGSFLLFLFGPTDDVVRLGPALAGAGLVAACWWLRPFLGRGGALTAALLLTASPLVLYESRRLTAEPYAVLGLLVLFICLLRLRAGGGRLTLLVATAAGTLAVFSHYLALPLALAMLALWVLMARLSAPSAPAAAAAGPARRARPTPPPVTGLTPARLSRLDGLLALGLAAGLVLLMAILAATGGSDLLANLLSPLTAWLALAPPAERAPLFLPLLLLIYEPLILASALAGAWTVGGDRETPLERLTGLLVVAWAVVALVLAAVAGDREPAQALYALLPLALLAGRGIATLVNGIPWATYLRQRGPILSAVSALAIAALLVFIAALTSPAPATQAASVVIVLLDFVICLLLVVATVYLMRPLGVGAGARVVGLTVLALLGLYTIRSATQLAYVQPADAVELAVQEQTTPGLTAVIERLDRFSRDLTGLRRTETDVTGGHGLEIAVDQAVTQPFDWYLREYPQRIIFDPAAGVPGSPQVLILSTAGEGALRAVLDRGYVSQRYPFVWSGQVAGVGGGLKGLVRYLLYREPVVPAVASEYGVYLRRDLADRVLFRPDAGATVATGPAANLFDRAGRGRAPGQFDSPRGIAVDRQGNIYVVDTVNARVQKFDSSGSHLWSVGSTGSGPGQFGRVQNGPGPTGIAVDRQGNLYIADTWNHRIVKLDPQGKFLTAWGGFVNTQGDPEQNRLHPREFYGPRSIAIGPDDALYVTDTGNKRVLVFDNNGQPLRQWGTLGSGPSNLNEPVGIAIDEAGVVYVADTHNGRIAVFDSQGQPRAQWPVSGWGPNIYQEPYIAIVGDTVYVTNSPGRGVLVFAKNGTLLGEERRAGNQELANPTGIAASPDGAVYLVDTGVHAVARFR